MARDIQLSETERWARIGATPMIGQNDVDGEVFTLDDARAFVAFARERGLGRVSTWSLNRDRDCGPTFADVAVHSNTCSGVAQEPLQYSKIFSSLPGRAPNTPEVDSVRVPDQSPTADDPANSPFPIGGRPPSTCRATRSSGRQRVPGEVVQRGGRSLDGHHERVGHAVGADRPRGPERHRTHPDHGATRVAAGWQPSTLYQRVRPSPSTALPYQARWSTQGDAPSTQFPVDADSPWQPMFQVPGEPTAAASAASANG